MRHRAGVITGVIVAAVTTGAMTAPPGSRGVAQQPQNPSPMVETTRPHDRLDEYVATGRRLPLTLGTLFLPDGYRPGAGGVLLVHFHGAPWLIEHHVATSVPGAALVTVQLGAGSRVYAEPFAPAEAFARLVEEARRALAAAGEDPAVGRIILSSFSAGYGAIRAVLEHRAHYDAVAAVLLADSMHAGYASAATPARLGDERPIVADDLEVFVRFAADAVRGDRRMLITHSTVYPGTYASTTETADHVLARLGLTRRAVLREGPVGMQQLSHVREGGLEVLGFAGNSAPDHVDHLYGLGEWLADLVLEGATG